MNSMLPPRPAGRRPCGSGRRASPGTSKTAPGQPPRRRSHDSGLISIRRHFRQNTGQETTKTNDLADRRGAAADAKAALLRAYRATREAAEPTRIARQEELLAIAAARDARHEERDRLKSEAKARQEEQARGEARPRHIRRPPLLPPEPSSRRRKNPTAWSPASSRTMPHARPTGTGAMPIVRHGSSRSSFPPAERAFAQTTSLCGDVTISIADMTASVAVWWIMWPAPATRCKLLCGISSCSRAD